MADNADFSPMMQRYLETKKEYEDCILFYRLGDFYEMFFDDAKVASKELELTLTGRDCGQEERAPMCGVPHHAVDTYLNRLVAKGYKVAICEQMEDPKLAKTIVKREVIRVVTPGTNVSAIIEESKNNYLACISMNKKEYGFSVCDITTGEFRTCSLDSMSQLMDELQKFVPVEILCPEEFLEEKESCEFIQQHICKTISVIEGWYYKAELCEECLKKHFKVSHIAGLGISDSYPMLLACGAMLQFLYETQKTSLSHILQLDPYMPEGFMLIDSSSRRNLELCETLREKNKRGSLLGVLDKTKTAMGGRLLRNFVEQPLVNKTKIEERLDTIEVLNENMMLREELREYLGPIYDLERLMTRVSYRTANPRDFLAFKTSIGLLPAIKNVLGEYKGGLLKQYYEELDTLDDIYQLIDTAIVDDPPIQIKEGGIIKEGYSEDLDTLKKAKRDGKQWLADLEERERQATGIKNLKVKYNKIFSYYLEVTNSYQDLVPAHYQRKQTLASCERYTTEELTGLANTILGAEERLYSMEYDVFVELRESLAKEMVRVKAVAKMIAHLDVFSSLAYVAAHNNYVRPIMNEEGTISIKDGRHPVVEKVVANDSFIANDTYLDSKNDRIAIITGPNMAGKSTYMRQTALIVLMAQIGCFVPAKEASIAICDRIFTRVGASDDLASGQSTFMVEMSEVANILRNATKHSLLILDEIGRGTSTFDGLSIAWAVVEYISNKELCGAKTLFATHYHELTELEGQIDGVNNYCIAVKEQGENIVFLRKILPGGADRSYGIQVARLAGVPTVVLTRANEIAEELMKNDIAGTAKEIAVSHKMKTMTKEQERQLSLFEFSGPNPVLDRIRNLDMDNLSPMQAFQFLMDIKKDV